MLILKLLIVLSLLLIVYQDFENRSVYWIFFACLAGFFLAFNFGQYHNLIQLVKNILGNVFFIAVQLIVVSVYFSFKMRRRVNIVGNLFGWGDVVFLVSISFYFSFISFLLFYITSLSLSLISWLIWSFTCGPITGKSYNKNIPLAGLQALIMVLVVASDWTFLKINFTNDYWVLNFWIK